jgi:hypothetical protein
MSKQTEYRRDAIMKTTRRHILRSIALAAACTLVATAYAADDNKEKEQTEIRTMAHDTLQRLYKADPEAKGAVDGAAGYAVFSNMGVKILVAGSGKGRALP